MVHRYIILAVVIVLTYFSIWAAECNLGCRPGRYGMHDDTLGAIRLPSCGTIGGANSLRCFGGTPSTGGLKSTSSFGHVSNPSAGAVCGPNPGPISGPSGGPCAGPSSGPSTDPENLTTDADGGGLVLPIPKPRKRERCACEACPCALIEAYVVPVARVGMRSADIASQYFSEITDRLLEYFGILLDGRTSGRRNAQIIRSRTTLYAESIEECRLVNNPNFERNVPINSSVNFAFMPAVTSTTQYVKELAQQITVNATELSLTLMNKTSDPSVKITEATSELSDKNTKLTIEESVPDVEKTSEIRVKQNREHIDLFAEKSDVSRDLSAQKTEKLSDRIVSEAETTSKRTDMEIVYGSDHNMTVSNSPDKNIQMSATTSREDHNMLNSSIKQEPTESVRLLEIEETIDPQLNCSKCVEDGKVCIGGCPNAEMKRNRNK